ncbi:hypothetical protein BV22DRAFT_1135078 [Leucogyrophana mollusca]|uniref:Uncharacterized protein n=1 Tax=Leucogyrophana mollusca TaxID=85980 RepID=A0ACB8AZH2_9AGAM|nr:hypothetical protein BV22DRAFT_1135078 [Leucogyrophana mollusca]
MSMLNDLERPLLALDWLDLAVEADDKADYLTVAFHSEFIFTRPPPATLRGRGRQGGRSGRSGGHVGGRSGGRATGRRNDGHTTRGPDLEPGLRIASRPVLPSVKTTVVLSHPPVPEQVDAFNDMQAIMETKVIPQFREAYYANCWDTVSIPARICKRTSGLDTSTSSVYSSSHAVEANAMPGGGSQHSIAVICSESSSISTVSSIVTTPTDSPLATSLAGLTISTAPESPVPNADVDVFTATQGSRPPALAMTTQLTPASAQSTHMSDINTGQIESNLAIASPTKTLGQDLDHETSSFTAPAPSLLVPAPDSGSQPNVKFALPATGPDVNQPIPQTPSSSGRQLRLAQIQAALAENSGKNRSNVSSPSQNQGLGLRAPNTLLSGKPRSVDGSQALKDALNVALSQFMLTPASITEMTRCLGGEPGYHTDNWSCILTAAGVPTHCIPEIILVLIGFTGCYAAGKL